MRTATPPMFLLGLGLVGLALCFADSFRLKAQLAPARKATQQLAQQLGLTDLALMAEAVHTRKPSLATPSSALLLHPLALEASPAASFLPHENLAR